MENVQRKYFYARLLILTLLVLVFSLYRIVAKASNNAPVAPCDVAVVEEESIPTPSTTVKAKLMPVVASWYDYDLKGLPGYSKTHYTAASRVFKRGMMLTVCAVNYSTWPPPCVDVRVNDYGPQACDKKKPDTCPAREIDLSSAAFKKLAPLGAGLTKVTITEMGVTSSKK